MNQEKGDLNEGKMSQVAGQYYTNFFVGMTFAAIITLAIFSSKRLRRKIQTKQTVGLYCGCSNGETQLRQ